MEFKIVCICLLTVIFVTEIGGSVRSSFGEPCNKTQKCEKKSLLGCFDGVCGCRKPNEMHFDLATLTCVTKVGERCKFSEKDSGYEKAECIENAECNSSGYCECERKYHEMLNGSCTPSLLHGELCSDVDKCSKYESLECVDGTCACSEDCELSADLEKCVGSVGKSCVNSNCISGAECISEKCHCLPDYFHNETDNQCYAPREAFESCTESSECLRRPGLMLECLEGVCNCGSQFKFDKVQKSEYSCSHPSGEYYCRSIHGYAYTFKFAEEFQPRCVPLLDDNCPDGYCIANAKCDISREHLRYKSSRYLHGICKCLNDSFVGNSDKNMCLMKYDSNCADSDDCVANLECQNGKCVCPMPQHQYISQSMDSCITVAKAECTKESNCTPNAFCDEDLAQCKCQTGFLVSEDKMCEAEYGGQCSSSVSCDSVAGLSCVNNLCECPDQMYTYSPALRKCIGRVGAKCDTAIDEKGWECIENAECIKEHPKMSAECTCLDGYEQTKNLTCQILSNEVLQINI